MVVSKDNGDTKMLLPIAKEAMRRHRVIIIAEGVGVLHYAKDGLKTFFSDVPDPDPKTNFDVDELLNFINPDVVLVGFPTQNHLSKQIGSEANKKGIPVVGVEDYWGCVKRNPEIKYSLVLTIDEYAAELAREVVGLEVGIAVVGNHAVPGTDYKSPEAVLKGMKEIRTRFKEVFVYCGGGDKHTTEELKLLIASLKLTSSDWCLIPRYHPNEKKQMATEIVENRLFVEVWDEMLSQLGERVIRMDAGNSDDCAVVCDAYFSGMGSSMSTAISCAKPTVAVLTEATKEEIKKAKLEAVPAVKLGGARVLAAVQDLRPLLIKPPKSVRKKFRPLDAKLALDEIESLLAQ